MKRIIVPIDFTEISRTGLEHAIEIAHKNESVLILVHINSFQSEKEAAASFDKLISAYPDLQKIPHRTIIHEGDRIALLANTVSSEKADFMIIATKGAASDFDEVSIAYQMIVRLKIPVLAIPYNVKYHEINKILFTTDYSSIEDSSILNSLHQFARIYDAKVYVLYVGDNKKIQPEERDQFESTLEYYLETIEHYYNFSDEENIETGIKHFTKEHQIDVLAMVSRNNTNKNVPSLVRQIALNTKIPLLTIPEL